MEILVNRTQNNYVTVSRKIIKDTNLSISERGLLITLMTLPDGWDLSIEGLAKILPDGTTSIKTTLKKLTTKGYITRLQTRESNGQYGPTFIIVNEIPTPDDEVDSPKVDIPPADKPTSTTPMSEYQRQYKNKKNTNPKNTKECDQCALSSNDYEKLVSQYGQDLVDSQIQRILDHHYRGMMNVDTIAKWCDERLSRAQSTYKTKINPGYMTRDYDIAEIERIILAEQGGSL